MIKINENLKIYGLSVIFLNFTFCPLNVSFTSCQFQTMRKKQKKLNQNLNFCLRIKEKYFKTNFDKQ